jgi:hypothetical protein
MKSEKVLSRILKPKKQKDESNKKKRQRWEISMTSRDFMSKLEKWPVADYVLCQLADQRIGKMKNERRPKKCTGHL